MNQPSTHRMQDVADAAGVSLATVSRVLNHPAKVAPVTLDRVRAAITRMSYVPNLTAGSLASNRTRIIGAIVPTVANSIFAETIEGLTRPLEAAGYQLLLGQDRYDPAHEEQLVAAFLGRRVDGLVLTGVSHTPATRKRLKLAGVPVVETWELTRRPIDMLVGFSNHAAGAAIALFLRRRGYRDLAFVGGEDDRSRARLSGFEAGAREPLPALTSPGARPGVARVRSQLLKGALTMQGGREALDALCARGKPPRAIFFSNDVLAAGALLQCTIRGWQVPRDIALVGLGDFEIAAQCEPGLTTLRVPRRAIGEGAAHLLLDRLEGRATLASRVDVGFEIIERRSA